MTRAIEGAVPLSTYLQDPKSAAIPLPPRAERIRLIGEFAALLRRAHAAGFFLHTLRAKDLLLTRHPSGRYSLHVIDVPFAGIWRWRLLPWAGRARDLALLMKWARELLPRTERMRCARAYGAGAALMRRAGFNSMMRMLR